MDKNERYREHLKAKKKRLLDGLIYKELLKDKRLIKAFIDIPLEHFIPEKFMNLAKPYDDVPNLFYYDENNPRSYRTISAPHMIAIMLEGLNLQERDDLLILGAKSGYIAALAHQLSPKGEIVILEANSDIAKLTRDNLKKLKLDNRVTIIVTNPLNGAPDLYPWQKILVTGAIEQQRIYPLLKQLDENGGVLFAPIGTERVQDYTQILRQGEDFFGRKQLQVKFSPLITQVELDELELITEFDEFEKIDKDNVSTEYASRELNKKVVIKYTSDILENVVPEESIKSEGVTENERVQVISYFESILDIVKSLKLEEDINRLFDKVEEIDKYFGKLRKFKHNFELTIKRMQNRLNQIRSYNIVRKEFENKDFTDPAVLQQKVNVINLQLFEIHHLIDLVQNELKRIKEVY
ncbi:MAG: protein-L-isoaspartate O-methyltransferase [Candidatus Thorarchaeota archaeon]